MINVLYPEINKIRVDIGESMGGHTVPEEKIKSRYQKALRCNGE